MDDIVNEDLEMDNFNSIEHHEIERCIISMAEKPRFCLTLNGSLGLVPRAARKGDIVGIMRGSPLPFGVRRSGRGESYLLMGQCYVHGFMEGEAIEGKEDRFRRIQLV